MQNKFVILIIDDNTNFVNRMVDLLTESGNHWEIETAYNFDQAIRVLHNSDPDIILLDINLPGKNGIEILRHIRQSATSAEVMMITNHVDDYYKQQCSQLGAAYFMDKSYDFALIPEILNTRVKNKLNTLSANELE